MATQEIWMHNVSAIIIRQVPLQSMDSAFVLVDAYLSNLPGGWVLDLDEQAAANAITKDQYNAVYDLNVRCGIHLDLQMAAKLTPGLPIGDAMDAIENRIRDFLTDQINNSNLPIKLRTIDTIEEYAARSTLGVVFTTNDQTTTQPVRQSIAADLSGASKVFDYKANGLLYARNTYGLDNTWNVDSVYTETNEPMVMQIKKYTSTTYATLDGSNTTVYVLTISPSTYGIVSGIILN